MPVTQLTAGFVQRATCPPGRKKIEYRDTTIIGFCVEVRASGGATYYQRYFDRNGRQRQMKIGAVNDITFDQARKKAKTLRADAVLGGDPMGRKEEQKAIGTYADLAELHIEEAKRTQRSWWSTEGIINNKLVPKFGRTRVDEIAPQDIAKWLGELADAGFKPATIDKYRVTLGRSYSLGQKWGVPGTEKNPVRSVARKPYDNARQRYLTADEAKALKLACELSRNKSLVHIVGLLILTGARKRELLDARWEHFDLEQRLWFIPVTKNGRSRHVPLSQAAIDILNRLPRKKGCPWLLPNPATGKPWVSIKRAWMKAAEAADLKGLRIHDLRHASASFLINAGVDLYAVGRVLGHRDHKSTQRYVHVMNSTLLAAAEKAAAQVNVGWAEPTT
jgi:integrase